MKTICFAQMKGGTGKTTISYNVACKLAEKYKVLVVDFDPQCNTSTNFLFDIFSENPDVKTLANALDDITTDPLDIVVPSPLKELENLDLFPSTMYFYGTEITLMSRMSGAMTMQRYMEKHPEFFNYYDYIIIDTAPSMGIINQNAFIVSDHIILVTDPDCNSAMGAHVFLKLREEARSYAKIPDNVDGLVINNVERTSLCKKMLKYVNEHERLSKIQFKTMIPHTTRYKECVDQNKPIHYLKMKNKRDEQSRLKAEIAIEDLVKELAERGIL